MIRPAAPHLARHAIPPAAAPTAARAWRSAGAALVLLLALPTPARAGDEAARRFDQALALAARHEDGNAMLMFEQLARELPQRPEPLVNLGVLLARQGRTDEARQAFERALHTSAAHALAHDNLARLQAGAAPAELGWAARWEPARAAGLAALRPLVAPALLAAGVLMAAWQLRQRRRARVPHLVAHARTPAGAHDVDGLDTLQPPGSTLQRRSELGLSTQPLPTHAPSQIAPPAPPPSPPLSPPASPPATPPTSTPRPAAPRLAGAPAHRLPGAEEQLLEVHRCIQQGDRTRALRLAEALVRATPHYAPARLACADLQLALRGELHGVHGLAGFDPQRLERWRQACVARLQAAAEPAPADRLPRQIVHLADSVRQVVVVEVATSRLFVLEHRGGQLRAGPCLPVLAGPLGREDGHPGTPLGLYQIVERLDPRQIGEGHGAGALVLDHPNEHDRRLGRPARAVWLHGPAPRPAGQAPEPGSGLVLADTDLHRLLFELVPRRTPVLIVERIEWVAPRSLAQARLRTLNLVEVWRLARARGDRAALARLYADAHDDGQGGRALARRIEAEMAGAGGRDRQLADLSLFVWQDREEVLLASFREVLRGHAPGPLRRQYWAREHGQWKIFSETVSKD
ncbi:L,D-transpeptidase [Sphaerotilus uruguayifluvii]|uniref:L,D-TPase catalytic domain-containing protein n=1 Tax=Sphaerotilus uruguayifluvii TaxID=2735897 RepID=A0ABX2G267_9BURK|nr:L,D-transpeptidase [Leptothrix sp. C29]NRT55538.1 hypothetical protein [Leptothrix sp. C29]